MDDRAQEAAMQKFFDSMAGKALRVETDRAKWRTEYALQQFYKEEVGVIHLQSPNTLMTVHAETFTFFFFFFFFRKRVNKSSLSVKNLPTILLILLHNVRTKGLRWMRMVGQSR